MRVTIPSPLFQYTGRKDVEAAGSTLAQMRSPTRIATDSKSSTSTRCECCPSGRSPWMR